MEFLETLRDITRNKWVRLAFFMCLSWFLVHTIVIICDGLRDRGTKADIAVIMGNKVNIDGTLSERLVHRLTQGLGLFRSGRVRTLMVSGGLGDEGHYEAEVMKKWLQDQGVPDSSIIVDNMGNNTRLSVQHTIDVCREHHFDSVIVVSQYYHITRAKMLFRKYGFKNVSSSGSGYFEWQDLYSIPREFVAYYVLLVI